MCSLLARSFVCEWHTISTVPRFQPPPRRTQHADFLVQFPEPPGRFSLRLDVYSPPQSCNDGRLCHLVLAFLMVGDVANSRAPSLHGLYSASRLLRTHPPPFRLRFPVEPVIRSTLLRRFLAGTRRASPVARHVLAAVLSLPPRRSEEPLRSDFGSPCRLHPPVGGSAFGATHFRGHFRVHCRCGPVTRHLPEGDVVDWLQSLGFPPPCYPNYGASTLAPAGLSPAENASLRWTHNRTRDARATQRRLAPSGETAGFLRFPVDPTNTVSDPPPSLHGHYPASSLLWGGPRLTGPSVLSASRVNRLCLFPYHGQPGSQVPYEGPDESHAS